MSGQAECAAPGPTELTWMVVGVAVGQLKAILDLIGEPLYNQMKAPMKSFLCGYYASTRGLTKTRSIFPIDSGVPGSKAFKVRWVIPGSGKSGGLRLIMLANCTSMTVRIVGAWIRKQDPSNDEIAAAIDKGKP
jgi:hypothetical protein